MTICSTLSILTGGPDIKTSDAFFPVSDMRYYTSGSYERFRKENAFLLFFSN